MLAVVGVWWWLRGATAISSHASTPPVAVIAITSATASRSDPGTSATPQSTETTNSLRGSTMAPTPPGRMDTPQAVAHNVNPDAQPEPPEHLVVLPIDHDHAMDMFADEIAKQENGEGNKGLRDLLAQFQKFRPSTELENALRANLNAWAAQLSSADQTHFDIVAVQCHAAMCRMLMAQNGIAYHLANGAYVQNTIDPFFSMQGLQKSLLAQSWWTQMGISLRWAEGRPVPQEGYILFTFYITLPDDS